MKRVFLFISTLVLLSCSSTKKEYPFPKEGEAGILAVYTLPDSSRSLEILNRVITVVPKKDSVSKKYIVIIDTVWYIIRMLNKKDQAGNDIMDSLKKPVLEKRYFYRPKDSVRWRIEGIPVDTLLKKNGPTH